MDDVGIILLHRPLLVSAHQVENCSCCIASKAVEQNSSVLHDAERAGWIMIVMNGTTNGLLMPWVITIEFVEVQTTPSFFIDASQGSIECCQVFLDVLIINKHCVLCGCPAAVIW